MNNNLPTPVLIERLKSLTAIQGDKIRHLTLENNQKAFALTSLGTLLAKYHAILRRTAELLEHYMDGQITAVEIGMIQEELIQISNTDAATVVDELIQKDVLLKAALSNYENEKDRALQLLKQLEAANEIIQSLTTKCQEAGLL